MEINFAMDRKIVADTISEILTAGVTLLRKEKLTQDDHSKIKVIRTLGSHINAGVAMIQQETAQQRVALVAERMKQLGYEVPKQIE